MFDPELYRSKDEVEIWKERDPIELLKGRLVTDGALSEDDWAGMEKDVAEEVDAAVAFAEAGTWEPVEELTRFVYSEVVP
jgi:TPP-dependent pyruvate/acetoin dehydrogenase alpha subunit